MRADHPEAEAAAPTVNMPATPEPYHIRVKVGDGPSFVGPAGRDAIRSSRQPKSVRRPIADRANSTPEERAPGMGEQRPLLEP
jgi:hypothetical protein